MMITMQRPIQRIHRIQSPYPILRASYFHHQSKHYDILLPGTVFSRRRRTHHMPVKNSIGIWAFGPNATRFVPIGYHPETIHEDMVSRTRRVVDGLADLMDGLEYHYPGEINEDIVDAIKAALGPMDIYCLAAGLHPDPTYKLGAFINPDLSLRRKGIETLKRGVDLAAALGTHFIIWPGAEGYNYNVQ